MSEYKHSLSNAYSTNEKCQRLADISRSVLYAFEVFISF